MPAFWLNHYEISFPHPSLAEPDGLLAVGGDLRPERLLLAYQNGIFPWYEGHSGFAWYSPDPRCVLFPDELKIQRSMRSIFNQKKFTFTTDARFPEVVAMCAEVWRRGQVGSWINDSFYKAYQKLFDLGWAHSVEVWQGERLVGGLYGMAFGQVFCGESMFSLAPNASKAGFIVLVKALSRQGFRLIDCQVETEHLSSFGARNIPRADFLEILKENQHTPQQPGRWKMDENGFLMMNDER